MPIARRSGSARGDISVQIACRRPHDRRSRRKSGLFGADPIQIICYGLEVIGE
jgi:hypothetical protein